MTYHKLLIPIFLTIALIAAATSSLQSLHIEHYAKKDGLAGTVVSDILHDSRGYMWFGTWEGLSRFDGRNFINFNVGDAESIAYLHNRINKVYEDANGNVWVMTYDDHLFRINRLTERYERMAEIYPDFQSSRMYNPLFASTGDVWAEVRGCGIIRFMTDTTTNQLTHKLYPYKKTAVNFIHEDFKGTIWLATNTGLIIIDGDKRPFNTLAEKHDVRCVSHIGQKVIWGCADGTIIEYDYSTGRNKITPFFSDCGITALSPDITGHSLFVGTLRQGLHRYYPTESKMVGIISEPATIDGLYTDSQGLLWVITRQPGMMMLDPTTNRTYTFTQKVPPSSYEPGPYVKEKDGEVWVSMTGGGFGHFDRATRRIDYFHNDPDVTGDMSNIVLQFEPTSRNVVWMSTHRRGIDRVTIIDSKVSHISLNEHSSSLVDNEVNSFCLDGDTIWMGTKAGFLHAYDTDGNQLNALSTDRQGQSLGRISSLCLDSERNLWIGTRGNGIVQTWRDNYGQSHSRRIIANPDDRYSISSDEIQSIINDRFGRIWIGTYGGGVNIAIADSPSGNIRFLSHLNTLKSYPIAKYGKVRSLAAQKNGTIWAGTTEGLLSLTYDNRTKDVKVGHYRHDSDNPSSLSADDIVSVFVDSSDELWVGTMDGGLCHFDGIINKKPHFTTYNISNGLPSNHIKSIAEDTGGNLWIATDENLVMFNLDTKAFSVYVEETIADNTIFSENAITILPNGDPLFGANNGYYKVENTRNASDYTSPLLLTLTSVSVDGKDMSPRNNPDTKFSAAEMRQINIPTSHSTLTISVSALNYSLQHRVRYRARLGSDKKDTWRPFNNDNTLTFTNIPSGRHTIIVRAFLADNPSKWEDIEISVDVKSPWWASWWLWTCVVIAMGCGAFFIYHKKRNDKSNPPPTESKPDRPTINPRRSLTIEPDVIDPGVDEDEEFIKSLLTWMEANYANPDMKIDNMVAASGLGRTSFYNRLKTIANTSPVEFVIDFRMKKAKMFIESTSKTISEIAYLTGYIDPHYFTRAFKTHYGVTPTQYRKRLIEDNQAIDPDK